MLQLYWGSGSREIELIAPSLPEAQLAALLRNAVRFLEEKFEVESAQLIREYPFELWEGTNSFGDEFEVLFLKTSIRVYLKLEKEHDEGLSHSQYRAIANALEKLGHFVRFIAVAIDEADVSNSA